MDNPAAWHPDPAGKHDHRWWDGQRWTEHVADAGVASVDPLPDAPEAATPPDSAPSDASPTDAGPTDAGPTDAGPTDAGPSEPAAPDAGTSATPSSDAGATGAGDAGWSTGSTAGPGTAGSTPRSDEPVWGQRSEQPPHQQPWGAAPGAAPTWSQQQQPSWGAAGGGQSTSNGMAVGALITGILSLPLLFLFGFGVLLGIVAVILGIIAVRRANRGEASGRGMAIGGIVTGAISIVLGILFLILALVFGMGMFSEMEACLEETGGDQAECERRLEEDLMERFRRG